MNHRMPAIGMVHAANARAYAIGKPRGNGFAVRRVCWGRALARMECRPGEQIKRAIILVERER